MKLTDKKVQNLKPKPQRYEIWEGNGFGIRLTPGGIKSWVYMYRLKGKQRRLTLGRYPKMTVAEAHEAHGIAMRNVEKEIDPGTLMVLGNEHRRKSPSVKELAEIYIEQWAKPRKRTWKQDQDYLNKDVIPAWGSRKAAEITRKDTIRLMRSITDRGANIVANRTLEVVRKMFNFGIENDLIETNPCQMVRAPSKEKRRERVLTEDEIKAFWTGLDAAKDSKDTTLSIHVNVALKMLLLTAQRRGEVATCAWDDIQLKLGWWTIPAKRAKNNLSHRIPLSPQLNDLLIAIHKYNKGKPHLKDSPWVFPSSRGQGMNHINPGALTRAVTRCRKVFNTEPFGPHDLRRTAASHMASMRVSRLVIGKILNHVDSSVTAVYDRHSYDHEKQEALEDWDKKVKQIVRVKNDD